MFENTYLVTDKLKTFSEAEVDAAEAQLGTRFPEGYREYMTNLGEGEYCGYVNVYTPQMIARDRQGPDLLWKNSVTPGMDVNLD